MKKLSLKKGSIVFFNNIKYKIVRQIDLENILVENNETNEKEVVSINKLSSSCNEEKINIKHFEHIRDKDWNIAKSRFKIIEPFLNNQTTKEQIIAAAKVNNIYYTTIYRWIKKYEETGTLISLVPDTLNRGGKDKLRIDIESEILMEKAINDLYLHKQKLSIREVYSELRRWCTQAKIPVPHENTVRNRVKKLKDKHILAMRESRRTAQRLYHNSDGMFPQGAYPLDVVQIDHTPMDVQIVDEKNRQPIGRPYLTLAIDVYSRMVTGFYIALEEPSYYSVAQCLCTSILPKESFLRHYGIESSWSLWGLPRCIHLDNAQEFRGVQLQKACENFGISIEWRPVARPQFGAHIERLIGTTMKRVHSLPGATFSNIKQRGDYKSEKEAVFTLYELEQWVCEFLVNEYHNRIHQTIKTTPLKKYEYGIFGDEVTLGKGLPERIEDEEELKISFLPSIERTIQKDGVKIEGIRYYHDCLRGWINAKNEHGKNRKFIFKYDLRDISCIWFYDPTIKKYFPIPYKNIQYPPISFWELREIKRHLLDKNITDYNEDILFATRERMNKIKEEAVFKSKLARKSLEQKRTNERKKQQDKRINKKQESSKEDNIDKLFEDVVAFDEIIIED